MNKILFVKNAAIISFCSIALRVLGMLLTIYMTNSIGAEGIGLYQLIISVYMLAATFSTAGVSTAVIRLISNELVHGNSSSVKFVLKKCLILSFTLGLIASLLIFFSSDLIGNHFLNDNRTILALKVLVFSFPFMSLTSCLKGYFIARNKASIPSIAQLIEQIVRIALIYFLIDFFIDYGLFITCALVMVGDGIAEIFSCIFSFFCFKKDFKRLNSNLPDYNNTTAFSSFNFFKICIPVATNRYVNSILRTVESLLLPFCFTLFYASSTNSLEQFGMVRGMALPLVLFPSALLSSISNMLTPKVAQSNELHHYNNVAYVVKRIYHISLLFSIAVAGFFFFWAYDLADLVYGLHDVGMSIRMLAICVPFMYLETIVMGMMHGLDQQSKSLFYNVINLFVRILLVYLFVPRFGINGYLAILIASNIFTCTINMFRLCMVSNASFDFSRWVFKPLFAMLLSYVPVLIFYNISSFSAILSMILGSIIFFAFYFLLLILFSCISKKDF